ncbi:MAG: sulfotransferase domain-containing protein [Candidatus Eisenbacteria bacterium]
MSAREKGAHDLQGMSWLSWKWFRLWKEIYQRARLGPGGARRVLLIVGCQRSGTTMMNDLFQRDLNVKVYREMSELSSLDREENLRLNPLPSVRRAIESHRVPLVVLKPLVESQNILRLLDEMEGSKALWMYRHYKDVAYSNMRKFGPENGIRDLRSIVEGDTANWRAEGVSPETRELVLRRFSEGMSPADAAALFWYVRNRFYFDLDLRGEKRVLLCRYEDMVTDPGVFMRRIYEFVGAPYPGDDVVAPVHPRSVRKGKDLAIGPEAAGVCEELWNRLEESFRKSG